MSRNERTQPTLVVFQGGVSPSDTALERMVAAAQNAATLDLLVTASEAASFAGAILVTEDAGLAAAATSLAREGPHPLLLQVEQGRIADDFHLGERLLSLCKAHRLERVVYVGGGSMPLATPQALQDLALSVSGPAECVVANNLFSADLLALYPASALERIDLPATDNDLAWLLHYRAGLPYAHTAHTLATHFDIDTPTDLGALWAATLSPPLSSACGDYLLAFLGTVPEKMPALAERIQHGYTVMSTRRAQVLVSGRVSSWTWRRLEVNLPCQTRILSEERGMRASGRDRRGEVRSLLGLYADLAGTAGMLAAVAQVCDAAFLDTRVLFAHRRVNPSRPDRFASDALMPELITEPWVEELTRASIACPVPVVLGGHSLISGGMWAMSERVRGTGSSA